MRPIDADELHDKVEVRYKNAPTPYRQIYSGFLDLIRKPEEAQIDGRE